MKAVFLIGMPGSGKSTIGRELARQMKMDFIDTDEEIFKKVGRTPENIIEMEGEETLRVQELDILCSLLDRKDLVVSTGGGLPIYNRNMKKMKDSGVTVYLKSTADLLWNRLRKDRFRPLSKTYEDVETLLSTRDMIYSQADFTVEIGEKSKIEDIVGELMDVLVTYR